MILFSSTYILFPLLISFLSLSAVIPSKPIDRRDILLGKSNSPEYKRLASYCYIDDYATWLQRQNELIMWLDFAKILRLPIHEDEQFQREVQQYRLQYECLRVMERLPVSVGPG